MSSPPGGTQSNFGHTSRSGSRARTWMIAGAVVAGLGAAALVFALRSRSDSLGAAAATPPTQVAAVPQPKLAPDVAVPASAEPAVSIAPAVANAPPPPAAALATDAGVPPSVGAGSPGSRKVTGAPGRPASGKSVPEKSTAATPAPAAVVAAAPQTQAPAPSPPAAAAASKPGAGLFSDRK